MESNKYKRLEAKKRLEEIELVILDKRMELVEKRIRLMEEGVAEKDSLLATMQKPEGSRKDKGNHFTRNLYQKEKARRRWVERNPRKVALFMTVCMFLTLVSLLFNTWLQRDADAHTNSSFDQTGYFISQIAGSAVQIAEQNDLYASVMIAQAIHESNSGTSGLGAAPYYNLFGIKGSSSTDGSVVMKTWEDDGTGRAYYIDDAFRDYQSWHESLLDYASLLRWNYYSGAWKSNTSSYLDATAFLTGKYATDTSYAQKLNYIIEHYNLTQYDNYYVEPSTTGNYMVWNEFREAYTSEGVLDEDIAWYNLTGSRIN